MIRETIVLTPKDLEHVSELVADLYRWTIGVGLHIGDRDNLAQNCHNKTRKIVEQLRCYGIKVDCWILENAEVDSMPPGGKV